MAPDQYSYKCPRCGKSFSTCEEERSRALAVAGEQPEERREGARRHALRHLGCRGGAKLFEGET
jgi:hypothetical protein